MGAVLYMYMVAWLSPNPTSHIVRGGYARNLDITKIQENTGLRSNWCTDWWRMCIIYRGQTDIIVPPLLMKIPQAPLKTSCGNEDGQCSHARLSGPCLLIEVNQKSIWCLFSHRSAVPCHIHGQIMWLKQTEGPVSPTRLSRRCSSLWEKRAGARCETLQSSGASAPIHFITIHFPFSCLLQGPQRSSSSHFECLFVSDLYLFHPCWAEPQGGFGKQYFLFIY